MKILFKNGTIVDYRSQTNKKLDLLVNEDKIEKIGENLSDEADKVIDCLGLIIMPGMIDMHCHLREPGGEHKETIETGSKSAVKGGFTTICPMPNTKPTPDSAIVLKQIIDRAKEVNLCNILPFSSVTKGEKGEDEFTKLYISMIDKLSITMPLVSGTDIFSIEYQNDFEDLHKSVIEVKGLSDKAQTLHVDGKYELSVPGDYNEGNATSAIIATLLAGAKSEDARKTLDRVHIPGRMEIIKTKNNGTIYVDYAHNYASLKALFAFLKQQTHAGRVIAVLGSPGDKGISRRPGFGKAVSEEVDHVILTTDDPGFEDPMKIAQEIDSYINHDNVKVEFELDREMAIEKAIKMSTNNDIVVLAGKGEDPYQKIKGVDVPYPSDVNVAKKIVEEL